MARTTKGRLFTRPSKKHGLVHWLDYSIKGERFRHKLLDADGQPITNKRAAKRAADTVMRPYLASEEVARRRLAVDALKTAEEAAVEALDAARIKTIVADMWENNPWTVNRRGAVERVLSATFVKDLRSQWRKFVSWAADTGQRFAEDITSQQAQAFRDSLSAAGLSGNRINKIMMCCRVMFDLSGIEPNPFNGIRRQAQRAKSRRELTVEELTAVCQSAEGELRPLFAIGLYTGMRLGDACRLDWTEIDSDYSRITRVTSKTGKEVVVPIHPVLAAILREQGHQAKGPVLPGLAATYEAPHGSATVSHRIQRYFKRGGIEVHRKNTGMGSESGKRAVVEVGFHSLRHSFISISAREGAPLHVIQALVGHASPAMQRIYLHASQADAERAIAALPSITGEADPAARDRAKLAALAQTLPIEKVREILTGVA